MGRKKRNKIMQVLGLILLLVSASICFKEIYNRYKIDKETEQVIEMLFNEETPTTNEEEARLETVIEETPKKTKLTLTDKYLGYIEFYGIKKLITAGTDKDTLDKGLVGALSVSAKIDDEVGNLIIAGHSISNNFQKLHYIGIGEEIKIVSHKGTYIYKIIEKHIIKDTDMSFFKKVKDKKILTLVTCKNNGKQRLIVIAELRG